MLSNFLKKLMYLSVARRLHLFDQALLDPATAQRARFSAIIGRNRDTVFGREHGFSRISTIDEYRRAVPIREYLDFKEYIDPMCDGKEGVLVAANVEMFGVTSGSSAEPKFIPITREFTHEYHNSHLLWMYNMVKDRSAGVVGSIFSMVSPAQEGLTAGGIPYGSSSGKQYRDQSVPIRMLHPIPYPVFLIKNLEAKYHVALVIALGSDIRVANSVNPSTLVMIADILAAKGGELLADLESGELKNAPDFSGELKQRIIKDLKPVPARVAFLRRILDSDGVLTPKRVWPNLCAINTWQGGNAPFYLAKVARLWGEAPQRCLGLRATEGMISIPLADATASAPLAVNGHFLEFVEDGIKVKGDTPTLLAHELDPGKKYRLIITTSAGLYRYDLGDIVRVSGMRGNTPEVEFLHKAGGVLSVTGEKVYEDQVVMVMSRITSGIACEVLGFSVTVELAEQVRYILAVELGRDCTEAELEILVSKFDSELKRVNMEYRDKRASGRLAMPVLILLARGAYAAYRSQLVGMGRPDGQLKPPHILQPQCEGMTSGATCSFFDVARIERRFELKRSDLRVGK